MKYKNLILDDTHEPASDKDIKSLENQLGCALPSDYVTFLKACNGGYLEYEILVHFENEKHEYLSFCDLYKVDSNGKWSCNPFELTQERENDGFPQNHVLPIARDGGASVLYIDLRNEYKVMAHIAGLPEWTGKRQESSIIKVADSFDEYLRQLTISEETVRNHIESFAIYEESIAASLEWLDSVGTDWRKKHQKIWNGRVTSYPI